VFLDDSRSEDAADRRTFLAFGLPNSERTQQDRADKDKHGAYRQNIESQGHVHATRLHSRFAVERLAELRREQRNLHAATPKETVAMWDLVSDLIATPRQFGETLL
jgi:hypothetical protein